MLKAIIFDMDGVLVDTVDTNFESFNIVLSKYKVIIKKEKNYIGMSLNDQLVLWKKDFPKIPENLTADIFSEEAFKEQLILIEDQLKPDLNIMRLIQNAKKDGIKIAVATSSTRKRAEILLRLINVFDKLDAFVCAEDILKHKPNPEVFSKASELLEINPENCIVVEDALSGIEAANLAGMKSVAKITGSHTANDFVNANYTFTNFDDLTVNILKNIFNINK